MLDELLTVEALESGYGQLHVLWGVELHVREGETIVLLGSNGAGKTTLLKTLLGLIRTRRGSIRFRNEKIAHLPTDARVRRGIVYMSELGVFPDLSIADNLEISAQFLSRGEAKERIAALYELFPDLGRRRREAAGSLSGGQRKILGVAKALAAKPRLLVMDEPSAGLSPRFVAEVVRVLADFQRTPGLSLLIAEQNVKFLEIADRVYTLDAGRTGFNGSVEEARENDAIRRAYFGLK
ncbi:ATP-binding cassette domain-containing protein [bacterium]|nr:MAG: ATP-binding cassette domain-containing protein [bacterium]